MLDTGKETCRYSQRRTIPLRISNRYHLKTNQSVTFDWSAMNTNPQVGAQSSASAIPTQNTVNMQYGISSPLLSTQMNMYGPNAAISQQYNWQLANPNALCGSWSRFFDRKWWRYIFSIYRQKLDLWRRARFLRLHILCPECYIVRDPASKKKGLLDETCVRK